MLLRANFSKAILCKPGQSWCTSVTHGQHWSIFWVNHNLNNTYYVTILNDKDLMILAVYALVTRYSPAQNTCSTSQAVSSLATVSRSSQSHCYIISIDMWQLWHHYCNVTPGWDSGTADHGVPDEVRRHRHHLPLPGLVTLHRRQQVEDMLCF